MAKVRFIRDTDPVREGGPGYKAGHIAEMSAASANRWFRRSAAVFVTEADEVAKKKSEGLTVDELKAALEKAKTEVPKGVTRKEDLAALLDGEFDHAAWQAFLDAEGQKAKEEAEAREKAEADAKALAEAKEKTDGNAVEQITAVAKENGGDTGNGAKSDDGATAKRPRGRPANNSDK